MTQHRVEIAPIDIVGWKQWCDCVASMGDELRALNVPSVEEILDRYEFRRCDYGMGINIDWPDDKRPAAPEASEPVAVQEPTPQQDLATSPLEGPAEKGAENA